MNALAHLLGTPFPLLQAPMAGVQGSALAIAVGHAGALGSLPCAMLAADALRAGLARSARAQRGLHRASALVFAALALRLLLTTR